MAYITADRSPNRHLTGIGRINHQDHVFQHEQSEDGRGGENGGADTE
jgi:hypothetical protein